MVRAKSEQQFKTEADLCAAFLAWLKGYPEWTPYAETEAWDILLAHSDGTQVGIQAKLKFNISVLTQAVQNWSAWSAVGPDFRAILVPEHQGHRDLCDALGLTLIRPQNRWNGKIEFEPDFSERTFRTWHYANPVKRHTLPAYVPDVPAGVPSPSSLTKWKIAALQISAIMELRGYVTRHDFRIAGIDYRRWTQDWLEPVPEQKAAWRWRNGVNQGFQHQHPTIYPKIMAEVRDKGLAAEGMLL